MDPKNRPQAPNQPTPVEPALTAQDVLTDEAMELWNGETAQYNDVPESRIVKRGKTYRAIGGPDTKIDAKALKGIYLDYIQEFPLTPDGWKLVHTEFSHVPEWVWGNYAAGVLERKMDLPDVERFVRPDGVGAAEATCPLCGRKFTPRAFQMIGKDGECLLTKDGQQIVHGNYFVCFYDKKLTTIAVCGFTPKHRDDKQCYQAAMRETAWKGEPQLGHTKEDAERILKIRLAAAAERSEDRKALDRLGMRPSDNDHEISNRTAGEQIFGGGRRDNGGQGGAYGDRGNKRRFQR